MAKGLRSSVKKANRSKLRDRVTGPVEDARTERLSTKLLELASQPKPAQATTMEVDETHKETNNPATEDPTNQHKEEGWSELLSLPVPDSLLRRGSERGHQGPDHARFYNTLGLLGADAIRGFGPNGSLVFAI